jgi:hydrogenase maturation protease
MSATLPARSASERASGARRGPATAVEVIVCGSSDRGDDGAPVAAMRLVQASLPGDVAVRDVGQLDVLDLLSIPPGAGVVIVDAATGIDPGAIVDLALGGLIGGREGIRARSSHALALPEVVAVAEMIRGRPLRGRIVAIGGAQFGLGAPFSSPVSEALGPLSEAIREAVGQVRPPGDPPGGA